MAIRVEGIMLFLIIFSVEKGIKMRGTFNFKSIPYSETLKNLFGLAKSLDAPMLPRTEASSVSAPLKTFLIVSDTLNAIPMS
jgi:hypothetical protein